jgi:hypothetical protein
MQLVRFDQDVGSRSVSRSRYRVPMQCAFCGTVGKVSLTARTPGGGVAMRWYCEACEREWPVRQEEQLPERRRSLTDRRRASRTDRRNRSRV